MQKIYCVKYKKSLKIPLSYFFGHCIGNIYWPETKIYIFLKIQVA